MAEPSIRRVALVFALWSTGCLLGAFDIPFGYVPLLAIPWIIRFGTKSDAKAELKRRLGQVDYLALAAVLGLIVAVFVLTHFIFTAEQIAATEQHRRTMFAILWLLGSALLLRPVLKRGRSAPMDDT